MQFIFRIFFNFLLIIGPAALLAQANDTKAEKKSIKSDRIFYSLAYYDLFENNISGSLLEKLTKGSYGFGDKSITREVILRQMIFSKNDNSLLDSLYQYNSMSFLNDMPPISENILERPNLFIYFYLINELLQYPTDNFFENIVQVIPRLKKNLSPEDSTLMEDEIETDEIKQNINEYIDAINWASIFPDRAAFFTSYFENEWKEYKKQSPNATASDVYTFKRARANEVYPIIDYYLPIPLSVCISEYGRHNSVIPSATEVSSNPRLFIENTYQKLLRRKPNINEMSSILPLYEGPTPLEPGILYYLIMSSEEYLYY